MTTIPLVDLSKFLSPDAANRNAFVNELGRAFENIGFVTVKNHGINNELVKTFFRSSEAFFALPTETKKQYEDKAAAGQSGYTSFGREHAKQSKIADLKEFWQFNQEVQNDEDLKKTYPKNPLVNELPAFNATGIRLYRQFESAGNHLLRAIALYLHLPKNYFDDKTHNGSSILRAIHYPPITTEPGSAVRAEAHEDINLITLLVGASAEGLQVLPLGYDWIDVNAEPGQIVINVGDMLQRLSNGRLKSTTHRVVNPPRHKWHLPRLSIPFFLHPKPYVSLNVLPQCIAADRPKQFDDITAGEYLNERLREIGLLKK